MSFLWVWPIMPVSAQELSADNLDEIVKYEGEFVTIVGKVVSGHIAPSGKVRFLNFGADYKKAFTAVIFTGDLKNFEKMIGEPTSYYRNKNIKISGRISLYKGKPQIVLKSPEQISIAE